MSLTYNGLSIDRFSQSITQSGSDIQSSFGGGVDVTTDSLTGVLDSIVVRGESAIWELLQGVYDSTNLMSAEGEMLDNLTLLVGYVRFPATQSFGDIWFTSSDGVDVPANFRFLSVSGDIFYAVNDNIISSTNCQNARMFVSVVEAGTVYNLNIDNNIVSYTAQAGDTENEILLGIQQDLINYGDVTSEFVRSDDPTQSYLQINKVDTLSNMALSSINYMYFDHVTTPVAARAVEFGAVKATEGTINVAADPSTFAVYTITNPSDFVVGSNAESDYQLRERLIAAYGRTSQGTFNSVIRAVSSVQAVQAVNVRENSTFATNAEGLPPKSYKVIVYGGNDYQVASAIWESKPAGIQPWSDFLSDQTTRVEIEDYNSQKHTILFTRPDVKYVWANINCTVYSEESLTGGAKEIIAETFATTGQALTIGEDVIPKRFIGPMYKAATGLKDVTISVAITDDINITPAPGDYVEVRVPISDEEITDFASGRVTVTITT